MTRRFFVDSADLAGAEVRLDGALARRLATVLRLRSGAEIALFDGSGEDVRVRIERASARSVTAAVVGRVPSPAEPQLRVHLYQSIAKGERFEWLLEKATELGVARVVPLVTARSVVRTSGGGARSERWRRIVIEAAEQSGRGAVPEVTSPLAFADAVRGAPGVRLLPYERAGAHAGTIASALANGKVREVSMLIGPEGGFEEEEVQVAREAGFAIVSLGPRALRSETAGIVALTLAMEAGGELGR